MYYIYYFDTLHPTIPIQTKHPCDEELLREIKNKSKNLDELCYLLNYYQIINSCAEDFLSFRCSHKKDVWKTNKYLLSYINAVSDYKNYVRNVFGPKSYEAGIIDDYYKDTSTWFRFVCEIRNEIVHQAYSCKFYDQQWNGYLVFDEILQNLEKEKQAATNKNHIQQKEHAIESVREHIPDSLPAISFYDLISAVQAEFQQLNDQLLVHIFSSRIHPCLDWFVDLIHKTGSIYHKTFVPVDTLTVGDCLNFYIEEYFLISLYACSANHPFVKAWSRYLASIDYTNLLCYDNQPIQALLSQN